MTQAAPEPVFEQPWHAQVFALTVAMNEAGRIEWPDWAARLSATLKRDGLDRDLDGGDDYFRAWLATLEAMLAEQGTAPASEVRILRDAWEEAFLATPHGQPVRVRDG